MSIRRRDRRKLRATPPLSFPPPSLPRSLPRSFDKQSESGGVSCCPSPFHAYALLPPPPITTVARAEQLSLLTRKEEDHHHPDGRSAVYTRERPGLPRKISRLDVHGQRRRGGGAPGGNACPILAMPRRSESVHPCYPYGARDLLFHCALQACDQRGGEGGGGVAHWRGEGDKEASSGCRLCVCLVRV